MVINIEIFTFYSVKSLAFSLFKSDSEEKYEKDCENQMEKLKLKLKQKPISDTETDL